MARRESPEHHLTAIAAVAAISLVLVQTISDRPAAVVPSQASAGPAGVSCERMLGGRIPQPVTISHATAERPSAGDTANTNCFQGSGRLNRRIGAG